MGKANTENNEKNNCGECIIRKYEDRLESFNGCLQCISCLAPIRLTAEELRRICGG